MDATEQENFCTKCGSRLSGAVVGREGQLLKLVDSGMSIRQAAMRLGIPQESAYRFVRGRGKHMEQSAGTRRTAATG
jgi:transposase-like protein